MNSNHFRALRAAAPLAAVILLTGAVGVSCGGDPRSPGSISAERPSSHAMEQWTPVSGVDTCTQAQHDAHFVIGPDGKKYPTWHAPTDTNADSTTCTYGHEHGPDPRNLGSFYTEIKRHFAWDEDSSGTIEDDELAASGIPFGYVAEQLDAYNSANGISTFDGQRHQEHTAYKIIYGTRVRNRMVGGSAQAYDLTCQHLVAVNQNTFSQDAFASNVHEATVAMDCNSGSKASEYPVRLIVSGMMYFGNAGLFDASALASSVAQDVTVLQTPSPRNSPISVTTGRRAIPAVAGGTNRLWDNAFVTSSATSNLELAIAERWAAEFALVNGATTYATVKPTVTALSPSRFYDPSATNLVGRTIDLCYTGLNAGDTLVSDPALSGDLPRRVRGVNECSAFGSNPPTTSLASRVRYDSASSPFRNCKREVTFGNVTINSAGRATTQYSTPFGTQTQPTRSSSSNVKQYVAAVNTAALGSGGIELEAVLFGRELDACVASVHIPN